MPWGPEERNRRSLSPHGEKEMQGHAQRGIHDLNSVGCPPMPAGILGAPLRPDPHRAGPRMPVHIEPSAKRPVDEPASMHTPHTASPHKFAPATERQSVVITPRTKP
jgi:hypothetical protein